MSSNSDLQATHHIIRFLEDAKSQSELVLDELRGLFIIVDSKGRIFRGNRGLAEILKVDFENVIGQRFDLLIGEENWAVFSQKINEARIRPEDNGVEFEMGIRSADLKPVSFLWNVRPLILRDYQDPNLELSVILGRDVTEVKMVTERMTRMNSELATAKAVQDTLFPETGLMTDEMAVAGFYQPATECGGDWWFYNTIGGRVFLWIGDATGHGVGAALVTSAARAAVSVLESIPDVTPAYALSILNRAVLAASRGKKYMSFCVVAIDPLTGVCTYSSAAHEAPLLILKSPEDPTKDEMKFLIIPASYLLGQNPEAIFSEGTFTLGPGDRFFLYTDGVTEAENPDSEQWGARRTRQAVMKSFQETKNVNEFVESFSKKLDQHRNGAALKDDVTFFAFERIK